MTDKTISKERVTRDQLGASGVCPIAQMKEARKVAASPRRKIVVGPDGTVRWAEETGVM